MNTTHPTAEATRKTEKNFTGEEAISPAYGSTAVSRRIYSDPTRNLGIRCTIQYHAIRMEDGGSRIYLAWSSACERTKRRRDEKLDLIKREKEKWGLTVESVWSTAWELRLPPLWFQWNCFFLFNFFYWIQRGELVSSKPFSFISDTDSTDK